MAASCGSVQYLCDFERPISNVRYIYIYMKVYTLSGTIKIDFGVLDFMIDWRRMKWLVPSLHGYLILFLTCARKFVDQLDELMGSKSLRLVEE